MATVASGGMAITYSMEDEILGTAGGVKRVEGFFENDPFLVWYADNLSRCDISKLFDLHQAKGGMATIALYNREDVTCSGIVGLGKDDRITAFLEKPEAAQVFSHWVNAGIYMLDEHVLDLIPSVGFSDFGRHIFPALLEKGIPLFGYRLSQEEGLWWIDTQEDLRRVENKFLSKGLETK